MDVFVVTRPLDAALQQWNYAAQFPFLKL